MTAGMSSFRNCQVLLVPANECNVGHLDARAGTSLERVLSGSDEEFNNNQAIQLAMAPTWFSGALPSVEVRSLAGGYLNVTNSLTVMTSPPSPGRNHDRTTTSTGPVSALPAAGWKRLISDTCDINHASRVVSNGVVRRTERRIWHHAVKLRRRIVLKFHPRPQEV